MRRYGFAIVFAAAMLLVLTACGGSGAASTRRAQTATAGAVSDSATVTAFALSRTTSTPGAQGSTGTKGTPTTAGKGPIFTFATFPPGGGTSGRSTASASARPNASAASQATVAGVRGNTYTDPQGRFMFAIPSGWLVQQSSNANVDVEVTPPNLRGAFRLASDTMPANASLNDYAAAVLDNIRMSFTNFQLVQGNAQQATIGGQPAVRYEFTGSQSGSNLHGVVYIVDNGGTVYGLFIAATPEDFDAMINQAKALLDSFKFF
jgi:hypothetical protein